MTLIVPLAGSNIAGPLGLAHLPRMWQKGLLKNVGVLPDDYVYGDRGFDVRMMEGVGIDPATFLPFLATLPTYLETEAWVRKNATKLDQVAATSEKIVGHNIQNLEVAKKMQDRAGLPYDALNGAQLNNVDDWSALRDYLAEHNGTAGTVIPAISSFAHGPLGATHVARLWGKAVIKAAGSLPEGYHSGGGPVDELCAEALGFDLAASVAFTRTLPRYTDYEAWVRANATKLDAIPAWNERMRDREKPEHVAAPEREAMGYGDNSERRGILLNDLYDWYLFHQQVKENERAVPSR
jgi:hypothetical protein